MKSTDRLLNILSYIASCGKPVFPKSIAADLDIPISSVYRILNILIEWEFVTASSKYGAYTLGAQSLKGQQLNQQYSLFGTEVDSALMSLSSITGESAAIVVADYRETICIKMIESAQALRCSFLPGRVNTLTSGASGKTLLAFQEEATRNLIIDHAFSTNIEKQNALKAELTTIQQQGYGKSVGEIDPGVLGIAAPIYRHQRCIAVVTIMAPHFRAQAKESEWIKAVLSSAQSITSIIHCD